MKLAYVIAAHHYPHQLERMLHAVFDERNLYLIHVDRAASRDVHDVAERFAKDRPNVHVLASRRLVWGGPSLVYAQLAAMSEALKSGTWDYFINLSGQDYPLRSQAEIRDELASRGPGKNFLEVLDFETSSASIRPRLRYYHVEFRGRLRRLRIHRAPPRGMKVYWGSNFIILGRAFCEFLQTAPLAARCLRYFRFAKSSDEFFFQTAFMNSPFAGTLIPDNRRLIVWDGGAHPRTLTAADRERVLASDALFARKFDESVDSTLLDELDLRLQPAATLST